MRAKSLPKKSSPRPAASKPAKPKRKLIEFDEETWNALDLFAHDSMQTIQELADEAFRDLLTKHERPTDLRTALRASVNPVKKVQKQAKG